MKHDIPPWFIPDEEKLIGGGEAEKEHYEETGEELPDDVCPYCGEPYISDKRDSKGYILHAFNVAEETTYREGISHVTSRKGNPAIWCDGNGKQRDMGSDSSNWKFAGDMA